MKVIDWLLKFFGFALPVIIIFLLGWAVFCYDIEKAIRKKRSHYDDF